MARGYRFGVVGSISTVPDGSTVLPTDDISIWLECAGRRETYTTLAQVLADLTCLGALLSNNNAIDYLVRSKTFAKKYNALVPVMTSDNTPSGQCSASTTSSGDNPYKAFDQNPSTVWSSTATTNQWIKYTFDTATIIRKVLFIPTYASSGRVKNFKISGSNDGLSWTDLYTGVAENRDYTDSPLVAEFENNVAYTQYRLYVTDEYGSGNMYIRVSEIQLYSAEGLCVDSNAMTLIGGNNYCANTLLADSDWREEICNSPYFESVLNAKVPVMTSNTTPSGECGGSTRYDSNYEYYKAFNGNNNSNGWLPADNDTLGTAKVYYQFINPIKVLKSEVYLYRQAGTTERNATIKISASNDGTTWVDVSEEISVVYYNQLYSAVCSPNTEYEYYCIRLVGGTPVSAGTGWHVQFYGRQDI